MDLSFLSWEILDKPLQKEAIVFGLKEDGFLIVPSVVEVVEMLWFDRKATVWHG
jgi:hypothetical protein